jgi:hypothetical protein
MPETGGKTVLKKAVPVFPGARADGFFQQRRCAEEIDARGAAANGENADASGSASPNGPDGTAKVR